MHGKDRWLLLLILVVGGFFRFIHLESPGYNLDEFWTAEVASGRGSLHLQMPTNIIMPAPEFFDLRTAPAWPAVWTHMEVTHPPLYYLCLRGWMALFGRGDFIERSLAGICSLVAIALLFDSVKTMNGRAVAFWAVALMIVACPQLDLSRKTRNYGFLFMTVMITVDALVRIEFRGWSRWRCGALFLGALATPLTHYFGIGAIAGLFIYVAWRWRGGNRRRALAAFVLAGIFFSLIWGPFFMRQLPLFSLDDAGVSFARDDQPGHALRVLKLLLMAPATTLIDRIHLGWWSCASGLLLVIPFTLIRQRRDLLLWALLLTGTLGIIALLDLCRTSLHLGFGRYVALAGLPVFVLIPALLSWLPRWLFHGVSAAVVIACVVFWSDVYTTVVADPNAITASLAQRVNKSDAIVFASPDNLAWARGVQAMMVTRYLHPLPAPVLFLNAPPTGAALQSLRQSRNVYVFSSQEDMSTLLPGFELHQQAQLQSWGDLSVLSYSKPK